MKYIRVLLFLLVVLELFFPVYIQSDNRIVVYLRHAPLEIVQETITEAQKDGWLNKNIDMTAITPTKNFEIDQIKNKYRKLLTPKLSGFPAVYGGYLDISNPDGMIEFPLRQVEQKIYVAFTEKIKLIRVKDNTFSHREFADPQKHPIKLYLYEKKIDDKKNTYWSVQESQVPADKKISPLTMVIFTAPSNVVVQTGDFISNTSQHFVLPEIYVIDTVNQALAALNILKVKRFFEAVKFDEKPATEKSTQGLLSNT